MKTTFFVVLAIAFGATGVAQAAGPTAIGTDNDGTTYAGFPSGAVKRYRVADGASTGDWTTPKGDANGSLGGVMAIDVAPAGGGQNNGNVWVLDKNRRVQEFSRSGNFIRGFRVGFCDSSNEPTPGTEGGIDVSFDSIYVSHPCASKVERYRLSDLPGSGTASISPAATATVAGPHGIAAQLWGSAPGSTQRVYVAQPSTGSVVKLGLTDLSAQGSQSVHSPPADVFVDEFGVLFVSTRHGNADSGDRVYQYDSNGNEFRWVGGPGSAPGKLNDPLAFDVFPQFSDAAGNLFIADTGNERVQRQNSFGYTYWAAPAVDGSGPPPAVAPANTAVPQIQGTATENNTVTCTNGTWDNSPTSFAFEWRRNGNPIGGATNNTYTIGAADVGQQLTCRVTATNSAGSSSANSAAVTPTAAPPLPSGPVGVSVNSAATFTNSTAVTLTIHEPSGANQVQISNDGGFSAPDARAISGSDTYSWNLASSGADRLPKTVYVRFTGSGIDSTQTYTDDIILDEAPPSTMAATLAPGDSTRAAVTTRKGGWTLKVRAEDSISGLDELLTSRSKSGGYSSQPYKAKTRVSSPGKVALGQGARSRRQPEQAHRGQAQAALAAQRNLSASMAVTVKIPAQLRATTGGESELSVDGSTVGEALDAVYADHGDLRERITESGELRRFVNVYVSGEDIRFQDGLETPVKDGDEVTILPAVAGG